MIANNSVLLGIWTLCSLLPGLGLLFLPFRNQLRFSGRRTVLCLFGSVLVVIGLVLLVYKPYYYWPNIRLYFSLLVMVSYLVFVTYLIRAPIPNIIFVMFVTKSYADTVHFFHAALVSFYLTYSKDGISPTLHVGLFFGVLAVILPMTCLFVIRVLQPLVESRINGAFSRYLCVMPIIFYILYRSTFAAQYLADKFVVNVYVMFSYCLWLTMELLCYYVILKMLNEVVKNAELQQVVRTSEIQLNMQKEQYKKLQKTIEAMNHVRHDIRQHLLVIKKYAMQKNCDGLEEYLGSCLSSLPSASEMALCANITVSAIVQYYIGIAEAKQIEVTIKINLPENLVVSETDCCVVLGNLLENAIESCLRQQVGKRFIKVKIVDHTKASIAISIINSFDHVICETNGRFQSSKRDDEGIGTASVRSIAEKYNGIVRYTYTNGIFHAAVLLNGKKN